MGGSSNIRLTLESNKNKIIARNKNFSALNNYNNEDLSTSDSLKNLSKIKTHKDLENLLTENMAKTREKNKPPAPEYRNAHEYTLSGVFNKAYPNFEPKPRLKVTNEYNSGSNLFGPPRSNSVMDPSYTTYRPYGFNPENLLEGSPSIQNTTHEKVY